MKKRLFLLLCLLVTAESAAWAEIAHGSCKNGSWVIDDSGKLTVNINGEMKDYGEGKAPWYGYRDKITAIHISSGCTNVGRNGFYGLKKVLNVTGGENVEACAMYHELFGKMKADKNYSDVHGGSIGDCKWTFSKVIGTLAITGSIPDFTTDELPEWMFLREVLKNVVLENCEKNGANAFTV